MATSDASIPEEEFQAEGQLESQSPTDSDIPLCPHCLKAIAPLDHFCPHCSAPISSIAAIDPLGQALSTGYMCGQLTSGSSTASFALALVILVPSVLFTAALTFLGALAFINRQTESQLSSTTPELLFRFLGNLAFFLITSAILWKVIQHHFKKSPTSPDPSSL